MAFHLVVKQEFGGYAIGDRITDAAAIDAVGPDHAAHVVRVLAGDDAPALAPPPASSEPDTALSAPTAA